MSFVFSKTSTWVLKRPRQETGGWQAGCKQQPCVLSPLLSSQFCPLPGREEAMRPLGRLSHGLLIWSQNVGTEETETRHDGARTLIFGFPQASPPTPTPHRPKDTLLFFHLCPVFIRAGESCVFSPLNRRVSEWLGFVCLFVLSCSSSSGRQACSIYLQFRSWITISLKLHMSPQRSPHPTFSQWT